jgi:hypothetical protein
MHEGTHSTKICPILAAFSGKDQVSTGSNWASRCKGADCAWWDSANGVCGIVTVAKGIGAVAASASLMRTA